MPADLTPQFRVFQRPGLILHRARQGPFLNNSWLIVDPATERCALVDPFYDAGEIWAPVVERENLKLESIFLTHAHIDHVCGVPSVQRAFPSVEILVHEAGLPLMTAEDVRLLTGGDALETHESKHGFPPFEPSAPTGFLTPGESLSVGSIRFDVLDTPGHCPGHVSFLHENILISGDVLFRGAVGFTDIHGANAAVLADTLVNTLLPLGDDITVYPGHASTTTIGHERETNPFIRNALAALGGGSPG